MKILRFSGFRVPFRSTPFSSDTSALLLFLCCPSFPFPVPSFSSPATVPLVIALFDSLDKGTYDREPELVAP